MRLTIRAEQVAVMEAYAQESFVRRIAAHLVAEYPGSQVILPTGDAFAVEELPEDRLHELVRTAVAKARAYRLTWESSIAAFAVIMFDVAPNFDRHRLCQVLLNDEDTEPNNRVGELIDVLSDQNWESIRKDYDPQAWVSEENEAAEAETGVAGKDKPAEEVGDSAGIDLQATARVENG